MPRVKSYTPIYKNMTHEEIKDIVNAKFPIDLRHNEDLVNRVFKKHGQCTKAQVAVVIKAIFESLRELIILHKTIKLSTLFQSLKLFYYAYRVRDEVHPTVCVKLRTPREMK